MRFDTIIIGGGLSGLACGISLAEKGKKCAVVSSGQSALHFSCGSFDLLGYLDGKEIANPLEAVKSLPSTHPYALVGAEQVKALSGDVPQLFSRIGVKLAGSADRNHYRLTPIGNLRPTWLTIEEYITAEGHDSLKGAKVLLLNITGYLDLPVKFIVAGLEKLGAKCEVAEVTTQELRKRRENASEMRSSNIAKVLDIIGLEDIAFEVNDRGFGFDFVLLPAVFGLNDNDMMNRFYGMLKHPVKVVATLPPSVPGVRVQTMMRKYFQSLGGVVLQGDSVIGGNVENGKLAWVNTKNLVDEKLIADNYVLATGNFFSRGLAAAPSGVYEPIFGLDVNTLQDRSEWYDEKFFESQPYMRFGVSTDNGFRASKGGKTVENLYVAGSVLSGANQIKEASMGGVSLITGLHVANLITK